MLKEQNEKSSIPLIIVSSFFVFYTLFIGKDIIIPFVISILFSFAIIGLSNFYQKFKIPSFISMIFALLTYVLIFVLFWKMIELNINIDELVDKKLPDYQIKINNIIKDFYSFINFDKISEFIGLETNKNNGFKGINFLDIGTNIFSGLASIFSNAGMIFFYTMFILLEYRYFGDKLTLMVRNDDKRKNITETIEKIKEDTKAYFIIKTIVSFLTAFFSYLIMTSFGLDLAIIWAILIFILNFIPNIGSVIALFFPIMIALVQNGISMYGFMFMSIGLIGIQILVGNVIEPKFMGNKLNLSPLAIIVSLSFWGAIWGVVGMILSVPIMVIINIILAEIPSTRPIAIMLSERGELKIDTEEEVIETRKEMLKKIIEKMIK